VAQSDDAESLVAPTRCYELYRIEGVSELDMSRVRQFDLTQEECDARWRETAGRSRVAIEKHCVDSSTGAVETTWYKAWTPANQWHRTQLIEWVEKVLGTVSGSWDAAMAHDAATWDAPPQSHTCMGVAGAQRTTTDQ